LSDVNCPQRAVANLPGLLHWGFANAMREVSKQMLPAVAELTKEVKMRVYVTGHQLAWSARGIGGCTAPFPRATAPRRSRILDHLRSRAPNSYVPLRKRSRYRSPHGAHRLAARPVLSAPPTVFGFLRKAKDIPHEVQTAINTFIEGQRLAA